MKKLVLIAMATVSLATFPGCAANNTDSESAEESVGEAESPLVVNGSGWAYVSSTGALFTAHSYNSSGGTVTTAKLATGQYGIDFNGISYNVNPNNAQVTAVLSNAQCKLFTAPTGNGLKTSVYVTCYTPAGAFVDSAFLVTLDSHSGNDAGPYRGAFLSTGGGASPTALQSWNSAGQANSVTWDAATQTFNVSLPGLALDNAAVHVTAIGATSNRCKIVNWGGAVVHVQCLTSAGAPTNNTGFSLTYEERTILPLKAGAHTWVNGGAPQASYSGGYGYFSCYAINYSAATLNQSLNVTMTNINPYPGSAAAIVPMVTAYGPNNTDYCTINSWSSTNNNASARVTCYDNGGTPRTPGTTPFTLTISSRGIPGPC